MVEPPAEADAAPPRALGLESVAQPRVWCPVAVLVSSAVRPNCCVDLDFAVRFAAASRDWVRRAFARTARRRRTVGSDSLRLRAAAVPSKIGRH
jgi:hypothetical protein